MVGKNTRKYLLDYTRISFRTWVHAKVEISMHQEYVKEFLDVFVVERGTRMNYHWQAHRNTSQQMS